MGHFKMTCWARFGPRVLSLTLVTFYLLLTSICIVVTDKGPPSTAGNITPAELQQGTAELPLTPFTARLTVGPVDQVVFVSIEVVLWQTPPPAPPYVIQAYPHPPAVAAACSCDQTFHVVHVLHGGQVSVLLPAVALGLVPILRLIN